MADRENSAAYAALRASSRRLLRFIEGEIPRGGGGRVVIFNVIGSRRV